MGIFYYKTRELVLLWANSNMASEGKEVPWCIALLSVAGLAHTSSAHHYSLFGKFQSMCVVRIICGSNNYVKRKKKQQAALKNTLLALKEGEIKAFAHETIEDWSNKWVKHLKKYKKICRHTLKYASSISIQ